jgi:hypothetical protein
MKGFKYITPSLAALFLTLTGSGQSRAYAKFDQKGETIGLFNLTESDRMCDERHVASGTVKNVRSVKRGLEIDFGFLLEMRDRRRFISFTIKYDAIREADIENLLINRRRFKVSVEACQQGGRWIAEKITRL